MPFKLKFIYTDRFRFKMTQTAEALDIIVTARLLILRIDVGCSGVLLLSMFSKDFRSKIKFSRYFIIFNFYVLSSMILHKQLKIFFLAFYAIENSISIGVKLRPTFSDNLNLVFFSDGSVNNIFAATAPF